MSVFDGNVNGFGPASATAFSLTPALTSNGTLDFAVGAGAGGNSLFDSTGLSGTMTVIPAEDCPDPMLHFQYVHR